MNKITYPLKPRQKGNAVANLQEVLLYILKHKRNLLTPRPVMSPVPHPPDWKKVESELRREQRKRYYGKTTKWLVTNLQYHLHLPSTGVVDEATADAINALLEEWGLLENGGEEKKEFMVSGRVVNHELRGVEEQQVRAVDKNIGKDLPLGETKTDERGAYEIRYSPNKIRKGKKKPDIQVQVLDQKGKILAVSNVRYNAGPRESGLDIVIPAEKMPSPPEFVELLEKLAPQLGVHDLKQLKEKLAKLKEDEKRQDITYLANKTGWDARMVAMTALASRFSRRSGVDPEFYYALFRAGVPANDDALSQLAPEMVKQVWEKAIEKNMLPPESKKKIPENLKRFKAYTTKHLLDAPAPVGISGLGEILQVALPEEPEKKKRLVSLYYECQHDLSLFWKKVDQEFGQEVANRLQLNGKLAFLTLNNAPLIKHLHEEVDGLKQPVDLVRQGFFKADRWKELLDEGIPVPEDIPGKSQKEKQDNYAALLSSQLRLSYPTAVISALIEDDEIEIDSSVKTTVTQFLYEHQGRFELGIQPIEQYLKKNNIDLGDAALVQLKKLQRVYQITPSDKAMAVLLNHNMDSAYAVVRYDEETFIKTCQGELGGETAARLTYAKAQQVHNAVLNIATSYMVEKATPPLYALPWKAMSGETETGVSDIIAYPTLESLFGEMDYCSCEHCRSWLSPAAYLVDLLQFLDTPTYEKEKEKPLDILLERRPDIEHLQLTCENTNTVLPYIDLVNEVLEFWVTNGSITGFKGHNIEEGITTEELLVSPQFVSDAAYETLKNTCFPLSLPFHRDLETTRRYFAHFDVPLHKAMEKLRVDDDPERTDKPYGWKDILMERLGLSRQEYAILADSAIPLCQLYGELFSNESCNEKLIEKLSNAKDFSRRLNLTYEELIEIIRTQFINPNSNLLPKLERLHLSFSTILDLLKGDMDDDALNAQLPEDLDKNVYGGDVPVWLRKNSDRIQKLIVLSDANKNKDICSFESVELRYFSNEQLKTIEFLKLLRFVRLWKKLGWSIEQTDKAIKALYPADLYPEEKEEWDIARTKLDAGFHALVIRLAHLQIIMEKLHLKPNRDLLPLLACWSPIDTHGQDSLYGRMFLNPTILALDPVFQEDGYGNYLADKKEFQVPGAEPPRLLKHSQALRAAFNLTGEEFDLICGELGYDGESVLNMANISAIFRHGYLARKLRLSVREFLAIKHLSGLDPFAPLDFEQDTNSASFGAVRPQALRFIETVRQIQDSPFKVSQLVYYLKHEDWSGKASPSKEDILAFARILRSDLLRIEQENTVSEDPNGEITRSKMALVYPQKSVDIFFGLLTNAITFTTEYDHSQPQLEDTVLSVTYRIVYDDLTKQLSFHGVMTENERDALKNLLGVSQKFKDAVDNLYMQGQTALSELFTRHPELQAPYHHFVNSSDPVGKRYSALLTEIMPSLVTRLKHQLVRETVSAKIEADLALVTALLEDSGTLHAAEDSDKPAIYDFLRLETQGLSAEIFFTHEIGTHPDWSGIVPSIDYGVSEDLPSNDAAKISGRWRGYMEASDSGFYNIFIEGDTGAEIHLKLDGKEISLSSNHGIWENSEPIELKAGLLYEVELIAKKVKERLSLKWQYTGMGKVAIPAEQFYPRTVIHSFKVTYLRLLKALAISEALALSSEELVHFASHEDYCLEGSSNEDEGWLNFLPVEPLADEVIAHDLFGNLMALLFYRLLKERLNISDNRLLEVMQDPETRDEENVLFMERVTGWREADITALLDHFGLRLSDLGHLTIFLRLSDAFQVVNKVGIGAQSLIEVTTNEPDADTLRSLQGALRARYDDTAEIRSALPAADAVGAKQTLPPSRDWLKLIQPINDELRTLQRDALVAYVLHKLGQQVSPVCRGLGEQKDTKHIDTPDKLFEYFLIDVEMDPCMKTSRIKQAISSVQLFVQRCLMNLEPCVDSADINAGEWEWMKHYRVWEANRKVFLWPENWLEPELRDDKSSFFKDLESELLQGDITEDAAATALVHYLEKLDEVARLEICGMYYEENDLGNPADDVVHVIARTAGGRRTYYYRRQEGGVVWTPWEKINLNIEDNPVLPVMWKDRLFLFWLTVMQKPVSETNSQNSNNDSPLIKAKLSDLKGTAGESKMRVELILNWSEYYHGKWQPVRTSDLNRPLELGEFDAHGDNSFDRSKLKLFSLKGNEGELIVGINFGYACRIDPTHIATNNKLDLFIYLYFELYNSHSIPIKNDKSLWKRINSYRLVSGENWQLTISYFESCRQVIEKTVLNHVLICQTIYPKHLLKNIYEAPFFCQNQRHIFFVTTDKSSPLVATYPDILVRPPSKSSVVEIPKVTIPDYRPVEKDFIDPIGPIIRWGDPSEKIRTMTGRETTLIRIMAADGTIQYEGSQIGPHGSVTLEKIIQ